MRKTKRILLTALSVFAVAAGALGMASCEYLTPLLESFGGQKTESTDNSSTPNENSSTPSDTNSDETTSDPHKHAYTKSVTTPTCTKQGYTTYTCSCGDSYVDDYVKAIGHKYTETVTAPTCMENGYTTYTCICGYSCVDNYVDEMGHSYTKYVSNEDATCETNGTKTANCDNGCGEKDTVKDVGSAKGHAYEEIVTKPTCTENGYTTYTCACGDNYVNNYVNATGHNYVDGACEYCEKPYTESQGLAFALNDDQLSYSVIGIGTCTDKEIILPSTYEGLPVTSIGDSAFYNWDLMTNVIISENITSIGQMAFAGCDYLTSITIPGNVETIGYGAFGYCYNIGSITLSEGIKSIGMMAFSSCNNLTSVTIPSSVEFIGEAPFTACLKLTEIIVSENNTAFKSIDGVLYSKDGTRLIQYPMSKTDTTYRIPDGVTNIEGYAFYVCKYLTDIEIPDGVLTIGRYALYDCDNLTDLRLPNSVTAINEYAIAYCNNLVTIILGNKVTAIANQAFSTCNDLENVYFYGSAEEWAGISIGNDNEDLTSATIYYYSESKPTEEGNYWHYDENGEIVVWEIPTLEYTLLDDGTYEVLGIGTYTNAELVIPALHEGKTVTSIGNYVFQNNDKVTSIEIPDSVTKIGNGAFYHCVNLKNIYIGSGVSSIGDEAFRDCESLINITVDKNNASYQSIDGNLYSKDATTLIQYAIGKTATSFDIPESVVSIGNYTFACCDSLTSMAIEGSVTSIGTFAFYNCDNLMSVVIGDGVTTMGSGVFNDCEKLTNVVIGDSIASVNGTFTNCKSLTSVVIGKGVTSFGYLTFFNCPNLTSVYYHGTKAEWTKIFIYANNSDLTSATKYYYSESKPTEEGNYWHYVDGVATPW